MWVFGLCVSGNPQDIDVNEINLYDSMRLNQQQTHEFNFIYFRRQWGRCVNDPVEKIIASQPIQISNKSLQWGVYATADLTWVH